MNQVHTQVREWVMIGGAAVLIFVMAVLPFVRTWMRRGVSRLR